MKVRLLPLIGPVMLLTAVANATPAAADDPAPCTKRDPALGFCIEWGTPGNDGHAGHSGGGGSNPGGAVVCYWVNNPPIGDPTIYADYGLDYPAPGAAIQWQYYACSDGSLQDNYRWVYVVPPEGLAAEVRIRIEGRLAGPVVEASPPLGTASILKVPAFVAVANWTGVITDSACGGGLCATVTATPTLLFDPGESGSHKVACAGGGTRFNRSIAASLQASAQGACAYSYKLRTGAAGRPNEWPGMVTVTWAISWTSTVGQSGVLPSVSRAVPLPRSVQEVQTVDVGGPTP